MTLKRTMLFYLTQMAILFVLFKYNLTVPIPKTLAKASATGNTHTVRSGETLYRIGQKYHVGVDQLRKWNNLDNNTVVVGQKLIVSRP